MQGRGSEKYWICLQLFCRTTPWERNFRWMHAKLRAVTWVAMCASWSTGSDRSSVCNHVCSFSRITRALGSWFTIGNTNLTRFNNFTTVHYLVSHVGANQCPNASLWNIWHQMYLRKTHPNLFCPPPLWYVVASPMICRHWAALPIPSFAEARLMYRPMAHGAGYVWLADHPNIGFQGIWGHHPWVKRDKRQPFLTLILQYPFSQRSPLPTPLAHGPRSGPKAAKVG